MSKSLKIGGIRGIPIALHWGLLVLAAGFILLLSVDGFRRVDPGSPLWLRSTVATVTVLAFLASVLAHELGHASVARRHGVGVLGISLSLYGGAAQLDQQAPTPRAEFAIATAGPLVNLAIGLIVGGIVAAVTGFGFDSRLIVGAAIWLATINIVLAVVNLFPAAPLDGGRVLTAGLWKRLRDAELARIIAGRVGLIVGAAMVPGGLVLAWWWGWRGLVVSVAGLFLIDGAKNEVRSATVRRRLARTPTHELMVVDPPVVSDTLTVDQLFWFAGQDRHRVALPVVRWGTDPIGYVVPADGADLPTPSRSWTRISTLMRPTPEVARAWMTEMIGDVIRRQPPEEDLVVVVHEPSAGRVVGTVSSAQLDELLRWPDIWGRDRPR